jgi:hypothetical protein
MRGSANVAPLPLIDPANAGVTDTKSAEVAIATIASLLREFIYSSIYKKSLRSTCEEKLLIHT